MDLKSLSGSLVHTIVDPLRWQTALGHLCAFTHTKKALISLRDKQTAQIVIPNDVNADFASPLIYGFDETQVATFLADFTDVDPWTEIERIQHPYFPYQMSRYLPLADLRRSAFWKWLEPQQIDECIVCELGRTDTYWAALNLYFKAVDAEKTAFTLERLKDVLPLLQSVWASARELQIARTAVRSLDMALSTIQDPAALVLQNGEIVALNSPMQRFLEQHRAPAVPGKRLSLPANLPLNPSENVGNLEISRTAPTDARGEVKINSFHSTSFADGEMRDTFLVSIEPHKAQLLNAGQDVWDIPTLTTRESTLVRLVANGMKFNEAQAEMGVSYPRVMQLWKSARDKLGVEDVTELRLTHRIKQA